MKKKKLEKALKKLGWYKEEEGKRHEKWTNGKGDREGVGRHNDIPEETAKAIIRRATERPGKI